MWRDASRHRPGSSRSSRRRRMLNPLSTLRDRSRGESSIDTRWPRASERRPVSPPHAEATTRVSAARARAGDATRQ